MGVFITEVGGATMALTSGFAGLHRRIRFRRVNLHQALITYFIEVNTDLEEVI